MEQGTACITLWLTPDHEVSLSHKQLADEIGIPLQTLQQRLRNYGPDHYLTYYPGDIPNKVRRRVDKDITCGRRSLISTIKIERLSENMHPKLAFEFIVKLISFSQREFKRRGCKESRDFLLNKNGMLQWYVECIPRIDAGYVVEQMAQWVRNGGRGPSPGLSAALVAGKHGSTRSNAPTPGGKSKAQSQPGRRKVSHKYQAL